MDCRVVLLLCMAALLALLVTNTEGRTKKVVIHVPYKVKKIKHTHTVYKMVHHHHTHHDHDHLLSPSEEHEHFHHMHIHDDTPGQLIHGPQGQVLQRPHGQHSQPVPGIGIPDFLPDVPLEIPLNIPDVPHDIPGLPNRHAIPLFKMN